MNEYAAQQRAIAAMSIYAQMARQSAEQQRANRARAIEAAERIADQRARLQPHIRVAHGLWKGQPSPRNTARIVKARYGAA